MAILINIDALFAKRKMSITELSERVGIIMAKLSILKNGKAKAIRSSTIYKVYKGERLISLKVKHLYNHLFFSF
ncbi:helix-turn-helix domain-containing protein [Bacillus sp. DJP31]|uniref:helix-turn-helix domain-containing protein n=1 Tax=Bacillus sp. DJP31 TaxID=3409789 RepID=UPI003BB6C16C